MHKLTHKVECWCRWWEQDRALSANVSGLQASIFSDWLEGLRTWGSCCYIYRSKSFRKTNKWREGERKGKGRKSGGQVWVFPSGVVPSPMWPTAVMMHTEYCYCLSPTNLTQHPLLPNLNKSDPRRKVMQTVSSIVCVESSTFAVPVLPNVSQIPDSHVSLFNDGISRIVLALLLTP